MVQDKEVRKRRICYLIGYIVGYLITLAYNNFNIFSIFPINLMSVAGGFILGTAIYYGIKPEGFYKYSLVMLKQFISCIFIYIVALSILTVLQKSLGVNARFFIGG